MSKKINFVGILLGILIVIVGLVIAFIQTLLEQKVNLVIFFIGIGILLLNSIVLRNIKLNKPALISGVSILIILIFIFICLFVV